jgi:hypothetical protein
MAISYRPSGEAKAVAAAGAQIGQAQARQRAEAQAQRNAEIQAAQDWELQKMMMNSQQDFAHEMRLRQAELDREARAKEWEVEKMELRSKFDFEQAEKERLRRKSIFNSGVETIDNNQGLTDEQKNIAKFRLAEKYPDIEESGQYLGLKQSKEGLFNFNEEPTPTATNVPGVPTANNPLGLNITEGVNTPVSTLPQAVLQLESQNKLEVISPDGKQETISVEQWPKYKADGYVLSQIKRLREKNVSGILAGGYGGI